MVKNWLRTVGLIFKMGVLAVGVAIAGPRPSHSPIRPATEARAPMTNATAVALDPHRRPPPASHGPAVPLHAKARLQRVGNSSGSVAQSWFPAQVIMSAMHASPS